MTIWKETEVIKCEMGRVDGDLGAAMLTGHVDAWGQSNREKENAEEC